MKKFMYCYFFLCVQSFSCFGSKDFSLPVFPCMISLALGSYIYEYDYAKDKRFFSLITILSLATSGIYCYDDYEILSNKKTDTPKIYSFGNGLINCVLAGYTMSVFFNDNSNDLRKKLLVGTAAGLFISRASLNGAFFVRQMKKDFNNKE